MPVVALDPATRKLVHLGVAPSKTYLTSRRYHYIVGRLDDMMVVGGENLYPADVENLLLQHEAVENVAVLSISHAGKRGRTSSLCRRRHFGDRGQS